MHIRTQGGTYVPFTPTTEVYFYGEQEYGEINWIVALKDGIGNYPLSGITTNRENAVDVADAIMKDFEAGSLVSRPQYIGFVLTN